MYETEADLARLQELIDASFARSSEHLLSIMTPPRRLTARRLAEDLTGIAVLNVATVTARGEPADQRPGRTLLARPVVRDHLGDVAESPTAAQPARDQRGLHAAGRVRRLLPWNGPVPATRIG
jgi:hypothetical protein